MATRQQYVPGYGPGQPAQQPLHPTVTYGQQGGQQAIVLPPGTPMPDERIQPRRQQTWAPSQNPADYVGAYHPDQIPGGPIATQPQPQPVPQQVQGQYVQVVGPNGQTVLVPAAAPAQYQQTPQPVQQPQAPAGMDPVLDGPNVPQYLRGRRLSQVLHQYDTMAREQVTRLAEHQTAGQVPRAPQQVYQQPQQQPQVQQQPGQQQQQGWQAQVAEVVRGVVEPMIAPVLQQSYQQGTASAEEQARAEIADFAELQAELYQRLQGAPPEALANKQVWIRAADMVRGERMRSGTYRPQQGQQTIPQHNGQQIFQDAAGRPMVRTQFGFVYLPQQPQMQQGQYGQGAVSVPAGAPLPQYAFFSEQPTPPQGGEGLNSLLTPRERDYARRMGMQDDEYIAWRGGVVR